MAKSFEEFRFNKQLLEAIRDNGFTEPTPIQEKAIPPILAGQDVMGVAQTGTGKTAAYVLPLLMKLRYARENEPRAVILAPTRELAIQIAEVVALLARYTDLRYTVIYGGIGPKTQKETIAKGLDLLIATPGRFLDLYLSGDLILKNIQVLVLDEADKMMDMGFIRSIHKILEVVPRKRQNLLFSATMSDKVKLLAGDFLEYPTVIEVEQQATPAITVEQQLYYVPNLKTKIHLLSYFLTQKELFRKVIIFCKTRTSADQLFNFISRKFGEAEVKVIHANKGQNTRINSINAFRQDHIRILVATDVAARGLDIFEVSHVVNFDIPLIYEDYVHRIGRTGRANRAGISLTFCTPAEELHIEKIQKLIRQQIPVHSIPPEVQVETTSYPEQQQMAKELDEQRKKADPSFKGAFHEKKNANFARSKKAGKPALRPKNKRAGKK